MTFIYRQNSSALKFAFDARSQGLSLKLDAQAADTHEAVRTSLSDAAMMAAGHRKYSFARHAR